MIQRLALGSFLLYLVLGERVALGRAPGFPGLPVLEVLFVGCACWAWLRAGRPRVSIPGAWIGTVGPLFFLLLALPLLGVLLGTYQVTSLYSGMLVMVPLAVLALTATVGSQVLTVVHLAIVIHGLYALGQALLRLGLLPLSVWGPLQQWDADAQRSLSDAYVIYGRSTGLFINANTFALWSLAALVLSYCFLRGVHRSTGVAFAIIGILGSQSRTGVLCLGVLVLIWAIRTLRDSQALSRQVLTASVFGLPLLLIAYATGLIQRLLGGGLLDRLASGVSILSEGVRADSNMFGRVEAWRLALDYSPTDPRQGLGTLGPPQVQFISFIDNQFVAFYLQGGLLLVGAFVFALLSPVFLHRRGVRPIAPLAVCCAVVALTSLTMTPLHAAQATCLVWVTAQLTIQNSQVMARPVIRRTQGRTVRTAR